MADTNQVDLDMKKLPDVSMEEETKFFETYKSKHLKLTVEKDALDKLYAKLDKQVEKRKLSESDKTRRIRAWIQSHARMKNSKDGLIEGIWDKETKQLYDEITGE
jgi:hypothetical protein